MNSITRCVRWTLVLLASLSGFAGAEVSLPSPKLVDLAFASALRSYSVFAEMKKQVDLHQVRSSPEYPGFFEWTGTPSDTSVLIKGYSSPRFTCANHASESDLTSLSCKMFIVLYAPEPGAALPPLISVKGTSSLNDAITDLFGQGTSYIRDVLPMLEGAEKIQKLTSTLNSFLDEMTFKQRYRLSPKINTSLKRVLSKNEQAPLFSGHSLGGSLVTLLACEYPFAGCKAS